jgi:hypothetical protein
MTAQAVLVKGRKTRSYEVEAASHVARMPRLHTCALQLANMLDGHLRATKEDGETKYDFVCSMTSWILADLALPYQNAGRQRTPL